MTYRPPHKPATLAPLILLLGALVTAAACSPDGSPRPDDVLVIGQTAEPKSLDPHVTTALNDFRILVNIYEGLVRFRDGTLEPEPALARDWEISDDGRRYTFYLRRGVKFHDGTPFDAEAVRFNFERMLDEDHPYHHTGPFPLAFFFDKIERIEVVDRHTVDFYLSEPFAPLLSNLAYPTGFIVSPSAIRRHGIEYGRHPEGTGPFRFADWQSRRRVMLERNPEWPTYIPPGPDNPLGTHALYLSWTYYRIHGTHDTRKIGRRSSNGCIGLYNEHIAELFGLAKVGTQVLLI